MKKNIHRQLRSCQKNNQKSLLLIGVILGTAIFIIFTPLSSSTSNSNPTSLNPPPAPTLAASLPHPQPHPLPPSLKKWQDVTNAGDYFSAIKPTPVGYLVWSEFPIKVYVEKPKDSQEISASIERFKTWVNGVLQTIEEWNIYLPLSVVSDPEIADITVLRSRPPIQATFNQETGKFDIPRARTAETRYQFYVKSTGDGEKILSHKFTIFLSPDQSLDYTIATIRHELGHALGIWGHSPLETDVLYFSQVRNPPQISVRDINTLKLIYQQPTRLGWKIEE